MAQASTNLPELSMHLYKYMPHGCLAEVAHASLILAALEKTKGESILKKKCYKHHYLLSPHC